MKKTLFVVCLAVIAMVAAYGTADALVSGTCSQCHTMHNSQGGVTMNGQIAGRDNLLLQACVPCHTTASAVGPRVDSDNAGGSFDNATASDTRIHNVSEINALLDSLGADGTLTNTPPGGTGALPSQLRCAGAVGCHGNRTVTSSSDAAISGFHHGSVGTDTYRFLYADTASSTAVTGKGANNYEGGGATTTAHNIYSADGTNSISTFCASCHGGFHGTGNTGSASPFTRHPTENPVSDASASATVDLTDSPFGFTAAQIAGMATNDLTTGTAYTAANGQVTCLSCHRSHGSAEEDFLRFSYSSISAGNATNDDGCENCHVAQR